MIIFSVSISEGSKHHSAQSPETERIFLPLFTKSKLKCCSLYGKAAEQVAVHYVAVNVFKVPT